MNPLNYPGCRQLAIISAISLLFTIGIARPASATFRKLFRDPLPLTNRIEDCQDEIRADIKKIQADPHWGSFQFECKDGLVWNLYSAGSSPISTQWTRFVRLHAKLFGLRKTSIADVGPYVFQSWKGIPLDEGWILPDHISIVKTINWKVSTNPTIDEKAARSTAESLSTKTPLDRTQVRLMIALGRFNCGSDGDPMLIWLVGNPGPNNPNCLINATTGSLCGCTQIITPRPISSRDLIPPGERH